MPCPDDLSTRRNAPAQRRAQRLDGTAEHRRAARLSRRDMLLLSCPGLGDEPLCTLYQIATSGDDPDRIDMALIIDELRERGIQLRRKPGVSSIGDGVGTADDMRAAKLAIQLFSTSTEAEEADTEYRLVSKWRKVGIASRATDLLRELEQLRNVHAGEADT